MIPTRTETFQRRPRGGPTMQSRIECRYTIQQPSSPEQIQVQDGDDDKEDIRKGKDIRARGSHNKKRKVPFHSFLLATKRCSWSWPITYGCGDIEEEIYCSSHDISCSIVLQPRMCPDEV
jgi:hypothetical protein